jgi:hypothetical protein
VRYNKFNEEYGVWCTRYNKCDNEEIAAALGATENDLARWHKQANEKWRREQRARETAKNGQATKEDLEDWETEIDEPSEPRRWRKGVSKRKMKWLEEEGNFKVEVKRIKQNETQSKNGRPRTRVSVLCQVIGNGRHAGLWVRRPYSFTDVNNLADNAYLKDAEVALGREATDDDDLDPNVLLKGKRFLVKVGGPINEKAVKPDSNRYVRIHKFIRRLD